LDEAQNATMELAMFVQSGMFDASLGPADWPASASLDWSNANHLQGSVPFPSGHPFAHDLSMSTGQDRDEDWEMMLIDEHLFT